LFILTAKPTLLLVLVVIIEPEFMYNVPTNLNYRRGVARVTL
jgi:hypothetical protein